MPLSDQTWLIEHEGLDPLRERAVESLFALSNGNIGTRAALPLGSVRSTRATFLAGVFIDHQLEGADRELVRAPECMGFRFSIAGRRAGIGPDEVLEYRRTLDMRRGELTFSWLHRDPQGRLTSVRILACASLADRRLLLQRIEVTPENYTGKCAAELVLAAPRTGASRQLLPVFRDGTLGLADESSSPLIACSAATTVSWQVESPKPAANERSVAQRWTWDAQLGRTYRLDRIVAFATARDGPDSIAQSRARLERPAAAGLDAALHAHEQAWSRRWDVAEVRLDGDPELQRALHFAGYHLIGAANPEDDRVSIGARGLTGEAYKGHVFWDTEIYMLPFYILTDPGTARALLMYRFHALPAARQKAATLDYRGALYAWESADDGREAAPREVVGPAGEVIPILTGAQEHHISADVAYAAWQYWRATQDDTFLCTAGAEILLETARFWASRATFEPDGYYHIRRVIGPDEYHETIDDNAYTNGMAAWNLRRGSDAAAWMAGHFPAEWGGLRERLGLGDAELGAWNRIADAMFQSVSATGVIEQFEGYSHLEDIDLSSHQPRAAPMDVLLGRERTRQTRVVKQADAVLLVHLLWDQLPAEVREATFHYYEPRTAHGSSLSPGIHAAVAARLGDLELALGYLRQAAATDLQDGMGNAAGGVHMGALGSLWQGTVMGFGGVEILDDMLRLNPRLPQEWHRMGFKLRWRERTIDVRVANDPQRCAVVKLEDGKPVTLSVNGKESSILGKGEHQKVDGPSLVIDLQEAEP
jgi:trehalose/maltose hydrolase-like predicted phosphorylase